MTTQQHGTGIIPSFTQGDRLRKARELTGMNSTAFAERIGVSQKTVNNAEADRVEVRPITINAWALATGVPIEWLRTGENPRPAGPDGGMCAARDSNPEPADSKHRAATRLRIAA